MSLRSSNQQPPDKMSNAIGSSGDSNPSHWICHLRAAPLCHVAIVDKCINFDPKTDEFAVALTKNQKS